MQNLPKMKIPRLAKGPPPRPSRAKTEPDLKSRRKQLHELLASELNGLPPELTAELSKKAQTKAKTILQRSMTPARQAFNGVDQEPHAPMADKTAKFIARNNTNFNPDLGPALARKKAKTSGKVATRANWDETEPIIPPSVKVQVCPGFRAPHERMETEGVFGAGFSALPIGYSPVTGRPW